MASDNVDVDVLIFFLSGDKIVDLYNKMYIKNGYKLPFDILSGEHRTMQIYGGTGVIVGIDGSEIDYNNQFDDFKKIISNFWMLVPEMKIKFDDNSNLSQLSNKMNLLIDASLNRVKSLNHDNAEYNIGRVLSPPNGKLYEGNWQGKYEGIMQSYYSDDKLYRNIYLQKMQYFIVPNTDTETKSGLENIQRSITGNTNINPCNITCKFINIDILQPDNIDQYTQLFSSDKITKVFIGDDFFDKPINNQILSNLLDEQQKLSNLLDEQQTLENIPEVILLPCLYKEKSTNKCDDNGTISNECKIFNGKDINTKLYNKFYGDDNVRKSAGLISNNNYDIRQHCRDNTIIGIVLDNFYSNSNPEINRIGYGGRRIKKSTRKTKKTKKPRKKSRKSRKQKKSRKH